MKAGRIILAVVILFATVPAVWGQYVNQAVGNAGNIDWSSMVIRATGIGAPNPNLPLAAQRASALEAAKRVAQRNLLEALKGVQLTSETTVRNAMLENDVITTRVDGVLKGFTIVDTKYMSTADVEVVVEIPLTGALSDVLLPGVFGGGAYTAGQPLCPTCGQPWPANKPVPPGVQLVQSGGMPAAYPDAGGAVKTGLIIDAKGLGIRPAMAPKIIDENGNEVYGSRYVSRDWAVKQGMVGYDKDVNRARSNDRVTNNPIVIKALRSSGANKADVVISNTDAATLHAASQNMNFLNQCKVMFIVD